MAANDALPPPKKLGPRALTKKALYETPRLRILPGPPSFSSKHPAESQREEPLWKKTKGFGYK